MQASTLRRYSYQSLVAAGFSIFCFIGYGATFVALRGPLSAERGWTSTDMSTAFAVLMGACALTALLGGVVIDNYGARPALLAAGILGALGCVLATLTPSPSSYALTFGIPCGISSGLMWVAAGVLVRDWWRQGRFGAAWGLAFVGAPVAQLLLTPMFTGLGWEQGMRVFGAVVLVFMLAGAWLAQKAPYSEEEEEADWTLHETILSHPFWALVTALFASVVAEFVIWAQVVNFSLVAFVSLFTVPIAGVASDYVVKRFGNEAEGRKAMLVAGALFGVLACALFLFTDDRASFIVASAVAFSLYWAVEVGGAIGYAGAVFGRRALGRIWGLAALFCVGIAPGVGAFFGTYMPEATGDYGTRVVYAMGGFITSALAAATLPTARPQHDSAAPVPDLHSPSS